MNFIVKAFDELSLNELWKIYNIRNKVFIVEQECVYQDVDEYDKCAYHIFVMDENDEMQGYARVLPKNTVFDQVSLGRVISLKRRSGLGSQILERAIQTAIDKFDAKTIIIEAQVYAVKLYEKAGFNTFGEEFLEDGIPHIKMRWVNE